MERAPTLRSAAHPRQAADEAVALAAGGLDAVRARSVRARSVRDGCSARTETALRARGYVRDRIGGFREADGTRFRLCPAGPERAESTETVKNWL